MRRPWDAVIIGAGAAGLMCALTAGKRGKRVCVLEHGRDPGRKILISGGGRCNFTNLYASPDNYLSNNSHFCKSALARYTPGDFLAWVEKKGIAWYEKKLGQLFCRGSAQEILDLLLDACREAQVELRTGTGVQRVSHSEAGFEIVTAQGILETQQLVLACGGLSIPKVGASDLGYRLLQQFGHRLVPTAPALVPLTLGADEQHWHELRGVAMDALLRAPEASFRENLLFAHFGLSGPAVLQISSYWQQGIPLEIDFSPALPLAGALRALQSEQPETHLHTALSTWLPKRWVQHWKTHYLPSRPLRSYSPPELEKLAERLHHWPLLPTGTAGYGKAEVTRGGADTRDFDSRTMASRKLAGLYCIGELMDVTGWLGGYNFQWAWASAHAAGQAL
ncbi:MAG: NAD(P)/FAD-dependent oxidoreductase [Candidatus Sericytochromatia bacterium]